MLTCFLRLDVVFHTTPLSVTLDWRNQMLIKASKEDVYGKYC